MLAIVFTLLVVYQLKHFTADFLLQGKYMLGKFKPGWDFVPPLAAHCGVHAAFTLVICLHVNPSYWWLSIIDFVAHFIMDRLKAGQKYLGRFQALSKTEATRLLSMGPVSNSGNPGTMTTEGGEWRKAQFRSNTFFWWSLGLDQMVHCLTHYFIIFMLVKDMDEMSALVSMGLVVMLAPLWIPISLLLTGFLVYGLYKLVLWSNKEIFKRKEE